jgi:hypothetical protein
VVSVWRPRKIGEVPGHLCKVGVRSVDIKGNANTIIRAVVVVVVASLVVVTVAASGIDIGLGMYDV